MKKLLSLSLVASSLLLADIDYDLLKAQMDKQQLIIEKLQAQIERLDQKNLLIEQKYMETVAVQSTQKEKAKPQLVQANTSKSKTFGQSKYIPDISLITDFSAVHRSHEDSEIGHLEIPGVVHGLLGSHDHGGHAEKPNNASNGFNFNYAELVLSSNVDPFFTLDSIFHITEGGLEVEELYATTTALGYGTRIKGGKFLSDFGYLNNKHHHTWSFADMPLVYEAFLGSHGINEIGLQAQWVAPTSNYLMFGVEVLQGNNEQMFGTGAIANPADEEELIVEGASTPAMFVAYAKSSFDIGDTTILGGLSYAQGSLRLDHSGDESPHIVSGDSTLYGADLLVKSYLDSYSYLSWQSEVLVREMDGTKYTGADFTTTNPLNKKQSGLYTQLEYGINSNWKTAVRYDTIFKNDINGNSSTSDLNKYSAMLEYRTSEFAKFRLQYNSNEALYNEDGQRQKIDTVILQANFAIGAHGAHSF